MGTTTTAKPRADWSLAPRGPVSATAQGTLALAALATVGDVTALDPIWGGAVTAAGLLGTVVVGAHRNTTPSGIVYRMACWIGGGGWLTWTLATTPWTLNTFAALGIGALTAGILAPLGSATPRTNRAGKALVLRQSARIGAEWEARLLRVCRIRATVTDVITWPTGTGYDVLVDLPGGGITRKQLESFAEALATDARLPEGCGVEICGGVHRGAVVLRVSTVNRLAQTITYPADYSPASVLEPICWGEHTNADPAGALVREESVLIAGKRGSGKTTLLQDISVALGRCTDNLVWHLDLNGGGLTQPWIDVWLDGRVQRCPIDWAAPNLREGKRMITAGIAIAKHRKASYRRLKRAHNTNLLPVSPDLPQITIIVDEGAQAVKDRELEALLSELQNIGRNEAVNLIISALRPTSDLVPVNMRKQTGVRIQMHGPDEEELGHMFGWKSGVSMDQLAGKGTGFVSLDGATPRPFRAYNVLPAQIEQAALVIATTRPNLDPASADAAGESYASRYQRMAAAFADLDADDTTEEATTYPYALDHPPTSPPVPAAPARRLTVLNGGADSWADPFTLARTTTPPPAGSAADWPDPRTRLRPADQLAPAPTNAGAPVPARPAAPTPGWPLPEILRRALHAFADANDDRMHSATLADALGITPTELAALLRPLGVTTLPRAFIRNGREARGYAREDLTAAAQRIHRGEITVPGEIAKWPAA
ncbi:hypothetical protein JOL79_30945 [Microbispora sp. RL4-1S]|uniref:FtsK domain-containing protein n=1 Tax=Microbispora oryzae TaxID=2806554 RepID=A0A941ALJ2_9ACTN|nr:hypothetical protein [Microbispora oryzae]MBP2708206.1 hypothetical protein [Microbispora oryzae]